METTSIKNSNPSLEPLFGVLTPSEHFEIRKILADVDDKLLEFAQFFGLSRAGWEGTGLDLNSYPSSSQTSISSFVEPGLDGNHMVSFGVSLEPTWFYEKSPTKKQWKIEAQIYADCQQKIYCGSMHFVHEIPFVLSTNPIDSVKVLHKITVELIQLGKEKPLEHWLQLAGDK